MDFALRAHPNPARPHPERSAAAGSQGRPGRQRSSHPHRLCVPRGAGCGVRGAGCAGLRRGRGQVEATPPTRPRHAPRQRPEAVGGGTRRSAEPRAPRGPLTSPPPPRSQGSASRRPHRHRTARPRCRAAPRARLPAARPTRPSRSAVAADSASQPAAGNGGPARRARAPGKCSPGLRGPAGRGQRGRRGGANGTGGERPAAPAGRPGCRQPHSRVTRPRNGSRLPRRAQWTKGRKSKDKKQAKKPNSQPP